ncbi:hypothetical protein LC55x_4014 [Lysobacter capsici]|nr:hypothetical protein LC55x_4014 [Lysobacter capsici]
MFMRRVPPHRRRRVCASIQIQPASLSHYRVVVRIARKTVARA